MEIGKTRNCQSRTQGGGLGRCVRSHMLLIGGSNPTMEPRAMANVLFFVLIFFLFKIFPKIAFIRNLLIRLGLDLGLGSGLFFKCIIFNSNNIFK